LRLSVKNGKKKRFSTHRRNVKMAVKVAINGFGRIGRLALRQILKTDGIEVVAVNDLTPADMLVHLFKYDTTQGRFNGTIEQKEEAFLVNGKEIKVFAKPNPEELPWKALGVDVVLECTGFFTSKDKAEAHIRAGARKVVISAPAGNDMKTVVFNVNHHVLDGSETVISAASCTTNCLAPMAAGVGTVRLRVDPANDVARRLYAQAGFRAVGPPISNGDGFVEMVNHLPGVLHLLGGEEGITDTHEAPPEILKHFMRRIRHSGDRGGVDTHTDGTTPFGWVISPEAYRAPGSPMSSHPDMSEAPADRAATKGLRSRPASM